MAKLPARKKLKSTPPPSAPKPFPLSSAAAAGIPVAKKNPVEISARPIPAAPKPAAAKPVPQKIVAAKIPVAAKPAPAPVRPAKTSSLPPAAQPKVPVKTPVPSAKLPTISAKVTPPAAKLPVKTLLPAAKVPVKTLPSPAAKLPAPKAPVRAPAPVAVKLESPPPSAPKPKKAASPAPKNKTPASASSGSSAHRVLFVSAECSPLAQAGGLGDAVAGLAKAMLKRGHEVRIVMPLYGFIDRARFGITFTRSCCVHFGEGEEVWVGIFEGKLDGEVPMWFIDYARYFGGGHLYGTPEDAFRFGVLSKAALQVCKDTGFIPHIVHVHDWMSAMAAVFLKTWDRVLSPLSSTASVLTIHNIGYQGKFDSSVLRFYGLGGEYLRPDRLEDFGAINLLKAGIQYADAVTTVSPTYAREIREPVGGMGLAPYLNNRAEHVFGILNGVDTTIWNPQTDKFLPARYSRKNMAGKAACKRALQERFGLTVNPKIPLFASVSRFAPQKGFDLLRGALPQALRDMEMQVVVLGGGDPFVENFFRWLSDANPGRANAHIGFVPELAHLIEAGSDFFLMPSIYEPCGLNQMYSSLYGSVPVVRATGGLDDTVENYDERAGTGTGFKFWEISDRALYFTIGWAVSTWYDRPKHYQALRQQGMARDFTWDASAREYEKVYAHAQAHHAAL
jgi:starch synthase